jgi:predicted TIM-barrel fold metal-dependent hydrolase
MTVTEESVQTATPKTAGHVDCDVHPMPTSQDEIRQYLKQPWRDRFGGGGRGFFGNPVHGARLDSTPPGGGPAGSDPAFLRKQLIEEFNTAYAILMPRAFCNVHPDPDFGTAIAAAYNDWLADTWLSKYNHDGVFKGSITINIHDPAAAAREIERWAGHPHFIQVMTDSGSRAPFGQRQFYPIYEACEKHGFRLAIHPGTDGMGINVQPSPGYPTHYIEWHTLLSLSFQAHLVSFLTEGGVRAIPRVRGDLGRGWGFVGSGAALATRCRVESTAVGSAVDDQSAVGVYARPRSIVEPAARRSRQFGSPAADFRNDGRQARPDVCQ